MAWGDIRRNRLPPLELVQGSINAQECQEVLLDHVYCHFPRLIRSNMAVFLDQEDKALRLDARNRHQAQHDQGPRRLTWLRQIPDMNRLETG